MAHSGGLCEALRLTGAGDRARDGEKGPCDRPL